MEEQHIGTRLKQVRVHNKLTQAEFASKLFVTPSYISKVESGKETPTEMFIKLVSHEYTISYDWLSSGNGSMGDIDLLTLCGFPFIECDGQDINEMKMTFSDFQTSFLKLNKEARKNVSILIMELTHILKTDISNKDKQELIHIISNFTCAYSRFIDIFNSTDLSDPIEVTRLNSFIDEQKSLNTSRQLKDFIVNYQEEHSQD